MNLQLLICGAIYTEQIELLLPIASFNDQN